MYGGVEENGLVSNELWAFDVSAKTWENITVRTEQCNTTGSNATILCGKHLQHKLHFSPFLNKIFLYPISWTYQYTHFRFLYL
jgi:hypothetical protein